MTSTPLRRSRASLTKYNEAQLKFEYKKSSSIDRERKPEIQETLERKWQPTAANKANTSAKEMIMLEQRTALKSVQQRLLAALMNERQVPNISKQSFSAEKAIGRKGGVIEFLGCRIRFPPKALKAKTLVKITIRSIYDDALQGYVVVSHEVECSTSGVPFQRYATISLPVHAMPRDQSVTVVTKQHQNSNWELVEADLTFQERRVSFQVHHFSIFKIFTQFVPWLNMHLCHNLYYKASTSQLFGVTCLDDAAVKKTCQSLENDGFKAFSSLPDEFTLNQDEVMSYRYACSNPEDSVVLPDNEIALTRHDFKSSFYAARGFMLEPSPIEGTNVVSLRYFLSTPQRGKVENRIGLAWNQTATPQTPPQYGDAPHSANITSARDRAVAAGKNIYTYVVYNICQAESIFIWVLIGIACPVAVYFSPYK